MLEEVGSVVVVMGRRTCHSLYRKNALEHSGQESGQDNIKDVLEEKSFTRT